MTPYLLNSFSPNMLKLHEGVATVHFEKISVAHARQILDHGFISAVGHRDTAALLSDALGVPVPENRATVTLIADDVAVIGQYRGVRLPEGTTSLPEGATIEWLKMIVGEYAP